VTKLAELLKLFCTVLKTGELFYKSDLILEIMEIMDDGMVRLWASLILTI
jgi:hypothetical protein